MKRPDVNVAGGEIARAPGHARLARREARFGYVLLLPAGLLLAGVILYPLAAALHDSLRTPEGAWGVENFRQIFQPPVTAVFAQTLIWSVGVVLLELLIGLTLALSLNTPFPGNRWARALLLLPWATPVPIAAMVLRWLYTYRYGFLAYLLTRAGLTDASTVWLGDPVRGFAANMITEVWTGIPLMTLILLAGLQTIPADVYEAAVIDGAPPSALLLRVTLPLLRPILVIATMLFVIWTFNSFPVIWVLTRGGPINATDTLVTYTYKIAFEFQQFEQGAALAVIALAVLLIFAVAYARLYFRTEGQQ